MIGPLLNICNRAISRANEISKIILPKHHYFGDGALSVSIPPGQTLTNLDLYNTYRTNEFRNLAININAKLTPYTTYGGSWGKFSLPNPFHPMLIKCSDTLTVNGALTAQGCGGKWEFYDDRNFTMPEISPIPLNIAFGDYGYSAWHENVNRLSEYGRTGSFLTFNAENKSYAYPESVGYRRFLLTGNTINQYSTYNNHSLFLIGPGGGGCHSYHTGSGRHYEHSRHTGLSSSGGRADNHGGWGGGGGGFLALYFEHLIIDGKEYGVDPGCDVSKISANGFGPSPWEQVDSGGGCMIIAARNIIIGRDGTINSDAVRNSGWVKPSFLNNYPCVARGQYGYVWNPASMTYEWNTVYSDYSTYYYNTGVDANCDASVGYAAHNFVGGAGIALGYKVS